MKQPKLGKTISELRQARGLTQAELAEMCDVNLRTIQRIEAAEVTPRSHTLGIIFSCLGYDYHNLPEKFSDGKTGVSSESRLGRALKYVQKLFNLKIDTMKKLSVLLALAVVVFCLITVKTSAQNNIANDQLQGVWELRTQSGKEVQTPNVRQKVYTKDSYVVLEVDKTNNYSFIYFIGKFTVDGDDKIIETPSYTSPVFNNVLSKDFELLYKIEDGRLYLKGTNCSIDEVWVKISD